MRGEHLPAAHVAQMNPPGWGAIRTDARAAGSDGGLRAVHRTNDPKRPVRSITRTHPTGTNFTVRIVGHSATLRNSRVRSNPRTHFLPERGASDMKPGPFPSKAANESVQWARRDNAIFPTEEVAGRWQQGPTTITLQR